MDVFSPEPGVGEHFALISADIFNVEDADGNWVDAVLAPDAYGWSLTTATFTVRFPTALDPKTPIVYEIPEGSISIVPQGVTGVPGVVEGTTVTYANTLPGIDLVYEVDASGYKETVVLGPLASGAIAWDVGVTGLTLAPDETGGIAVQAAGTPIAQMPAPFVYDSAPVEPVVSFPTYVLTELGSGAYALATAIDPTFLATATFPVYLDPGTRNDPPTADSYVNGTSGNLNKNYGSAITRRTGPTANYLAFIKFDPVWHNPGRLIYDAKVYAKNITEATPTANVIAKRPTAWWSESTIT